MRLADGTEIEEKVPPSIKRWVLGDPIEERSVCKMSAGGSFV